MCGGGWVGQETGVVYNLYVFSGAVDAAGSGRCWCYGDVPIHAVG
jgi:hypothetical protein